MKHNSVINNLKNISNIMMIYVVSEDPWNY